ncbi:MAG: class I SAM-dependent methyltransferase, partial [Anaerolineae bacterium]
MCSCNYAQLYDAYYYAHDCGSPYQRDPHWLAFFGAIADQIVARIAPRTVLDAGCAMGFLVEELRRRGVDCYGVDISEYAIANVHPDIRPFCWVGSICDPFPQRYDLIVCIEILEHVPAAESQKAIANLCQHTDDILFSSTPFDYKEATHLNVQPPEHWAEMFAQHKFFRDVDFDASFILPWAVRFRRRQDPPPRLVREYERRFWRLWKENLELRELSLEMRRQLAVPEDKLAQSGARVMELKSECEWLRHQLRWQRRDKWKIVLYRFWQRLHPVRLLGGRLIKRLPVPVQQPIVQTFVAEGNNLCSISLLVENWPCSLASPLHVILTAAEDPDWILLKRIISPHQLPARGELRLEFEPVD